MELMEENPGSMGYTISPVKLSLKWRCHTRKTGAQMNIKWRFLPNIIDLGPDLLESLENVGAVHLKYNVECLHDCNSI